MLAVPRGGRILLAAAALGVLPQRSSAEVPAGRDYATVGNIVSRRVEGRTIVVVPIAGTLNARLSEPFRVGDHWRLYLTVEDAKLAFRGVKPHRPEGVMSLAASEDGVDVRIAIDVAKLGDYGARRSEEGMLIWIDDQRSVRAPDTAVAVVTPEVAPAPPAVSRAAAPRAAEPPRGGGWMRIVLFVVLAAGAGLAVRHVGRNGTPEWLSGGLAGLGPRLRALVSGSRGSAEPSVKKTGAPAAKAAVRTPLMMTDPRGSSADIGDAFRVEPDMPPSGIAALAGSNHADDA